MKKLQVQADELIPKWLKWRSTKFEKFCRCRNPCRLNDLKVIARFDWTLLARIGRTKDTTSHCKAFMQSRV